MKYLNLLFIILVSLSFYGCFNSTIQDEKDYDLIADSLTNFAQNNPDSIKHYINFLGNHCFYREGNNNKIMIDTLARDSLDKMFSKFFIEHVERYHKGENTQLFFIKESIYMLEYKNGCKADTCWKKLEKPSRANSVNAK